MEFALCSVLLMLITVGVTDFSRLFTVADMAASAAAAGTQYGSLSPAHYTDYAGMQNAALDDLGHMMGVTAAASQTCYCGYGGSPVPCPADCSHSGGTPEIYVTVNVSVPFSPAFSYPWVPNVSSISGSSSIRVQ